MYVFEIYCSVSHAELQFICVVCVTSYCAYCVAQVVMGGGQEAMEVTTTSTRIGKFEARLVCLTDSHTCGKCHFQAW